MDSIDVHPRFASMQIRNDCNAEVEVVGPVSELQIVARSSLAEQRLHNHGIWCRRKANKADRAKPLQEPAPRDHALNSRFQAAWWQRKVRPLCRTIASSLLPSSFLVVREAQSQLQRRFDRR